MKRLLKIDAEGFLMFGEDLFLQEEEEAPAGYIEELLPTNELGHQLPYYRPKWTGAEWFEDMSQSEIDELNKPQPNTPTDSERIDSLENTILFLLGGI